MKVKTSHVMAALLMLGSLGTTVPAQAVNAARDATFGKRFGDDAYSKRS